MFRNHLRSGVAVGLLATLLAGTANAQQAEDDVVLAPIDVQGQSAGTARGGQEGEDGPTVATKQETVLTNRTTRAELDAAQIEDVRDIDRIEPGVSFSEASQSFNVRGLDRSRVLTTVDGIRLPYIPDVANRSGNGTAFGGVSSFNFNSLSALDVVKGSDSTVFGGGGIGGVVALRTLEPEDLIEVDKSWGGITKSTYDSRDKSWSINQALAGRVDNTFFMVQGGYRDGEEIENKGTLDIDGPTRTAKNPADFEQHNVLVKLKQHVDGGHVFGITGELFDRENDINKRDLATSTVAGSAFSNEVNKRQRISLHYTYDPEETGAGWLDGADVVAYWQHQELDSDYNSLRRISSPFMPLPAPTGPFQRTVDYDQTLYGINGSGLKIVDTASAEHRVSFGMELFGSKAEQYSGGFDNCPDPAPAGSTCSFLHTNQADMPEVNGATVGVFVQDEIHVMDGTVRVTPGLRFDAYSEDPEDTPEFGENLLHTLIGVPEESSDSALSGKLRVEADVADRITVFGQWAQGFRAPNAAELFQVYGGPNTYARIGNPDLKPETSNGFDIGALVGDKQAGGSVKAFYNRYKDFIDDIPVTEASIGVPTGTFPQGVTRYVNRANVEIYGAEVSAHYKHESGWHGWGQLGAYVGEDLDDNVKLNTIPAAKLVLGAGYATEEWGTDLIFTAAAARKDNDVERIPNPALPGTYFYPSTTPSYSLLDLTTWWSPAAVKGLTLRAGLYNIFDEKYYDTLDFASNPANKEYYTEPGRNVRVGATYKF